MTRTRLTTQLFAAAAMLLVTVGALPAAAQTFDAAVEAYERGDYATALAGFQNYAAQVNAAAQFLLGLMYANGEGVPKDDAEAVRWYRLAAEQGLAAAQFGLGLMYANGKGVPKDDAEAVRWYRLAAEQGYAAAQSNLGLMYANGEGVPEDDAEAARWVRLAAEQGTATAQLNLGLMYASGEGVPKDDAEAMRWYRLAAEQGNNADAQVLLGVMYANGEGVPEDDVTAYAWLNIAAAQGQSSANEGKEHVAKHMTQSQVAKAQKLSREYWTRYVSLSNSPSDSQSTVPAGLRGKPGVSSVLTHNRRNYGSRPPRGFRRCHHPGPSSTPRRASSSRPRSAPSFRAENFFTCSRKLDGWAPRRPDSGLTRRSDRLRRLRTDAASPRHGWTTRQA